MSSTCNGFSNFLFVLLDSSLSVLSTKSAFLGLLVLRRFPSCTCTTPTFLGRVSWYPSDPGPCYLRGSPKGSLLETDLVVAPVSVQTFFFCFFNPTSTGSLSGRTDRG